MQLLAKLSEFLLNKFTLIVKHACLLVKPINLARLIIYWYLGVCKAPETSVVYKHSQRQPQLLTLIHPRIHIKCIKKAVHSPKLLPVPLPPPLAPLRVIKPINVRHLVHYVFVDVNINAFHDIR